MPRWLHGRCSHWCRAWHALLALFLLLGTGPLVAAEPARSIVVRPPAEGGPRVAAVLGNGSYTAGALANPRHDATAVAAALRRLGFDVELMLDGTRAELDGLFRRFSARAERAAVALFYYAGHGIQVNGSNYLVPVDAQPRSERDLKRDLIRIDDVVDDMGAARIRLVFFDACRDNPLARSFSRGGSRGLAPPVEASGTLISFATKHGNTAADGDGRHSPYTAALLSELEKPRGVEIEQLLRRVQQSVRQATRGEQEPWRYGSLDGDFFFEPGDSAADLARAQKEAVERAVDEAVRRANAQAAQEKAELLARMEQQLKAALEKQNAALEAERQAWLAASREAQKEAQREAARLAALSPPAPVVPPPAVAPAAPAAVVRPAAVAAAASEGAGSGDEWEYVARDAFGRRQKLVTRVKAVVPGTGVMEEFAVDGKTAAQWVLDGTPRLIGLPYEAIFLFAPHWNGATTELAILNAAACLAIQHATGCAAAWMRAAGSERVSVPAGSFETRKYELRVIGSSDWGPAMLDLVVWYAPELQRTVRQTIRGRHPISEAAVNALNETVELVAVRRAQR